MNTRGTHRHCKLFDMLLQCLAVGASQCRVLEINIDNLVGILQKHPTIGAKVFQVKFFAGFLIFLSEFIEGFKDGYETVIGERGVTLSGGQRQRLALARAFLTNPQILILDDSTSAIDSATEDKIQRAIYRAAQGRTTLIITHRLSQIRWADLIVVMRGGAIAAIGNHDELMQQSVTYRQIFSE